MIAAGPERDREIAKIKFPHHEIFSTNHKGATMWWTRDPCKLRGYGHGNPRHKVRPYSTDTTTAMELLEEMIQHWDFVDISCCQRGYVINLLMNLENFHNTHGNTLANAISGAWQKWKESA